jgi:hypothetical protein
MSGPGGVASADPDPNHGNLHERSDTMADEANIANSAPDATLCHSAEMTKNVFAALCDGFGVEDIHAQGIADIEYARDIVRKLTAMGIVGHLYRTEK